MSNKSHDFTSLLPGYISYPYLVDPMALNKEENYVENNCVKGFLDYNNIAREGIPHQDYKLIKNSHWWTYETISNDNMPNVISSKWLHIELNRLWLLLRSTNTDPNNTYISIIWKIGLDNGNIKSCSNLIHTSLSWKDFARTYNTMLNIFSFEFFMTNISEAEQQEFLKEGYRPKAKIIFNFRNQKVKHTSFEALIDPESIKKTGVKGIITLNNFSIRQLSIPNTMDLFQWDNSLKFDDAYESAILMKDIIFDVGARTMVLNIKIKAYEIISDVLLNNKVVLTIKDKVHNTKDLDSFERLIIKNKIHTHQIIRDGKIVTEWVDRPTKYLKPVSKDLIDLNKNKIITLDIETTKVEGSLVPILISFYDGVKKYNFPLKVETWKVDIMEALKFLLKRKYDGFKVYTHNFSYFDSIFLLTSIAKLGDTNLMMRENKILSLELRFKSSKNRISKIVFMDSLLILPDSLKKLSKNFKIEMPKLDFPVLLLNKENLDLNYNGPVPAYEYFPKANTPEFTMADYDTYKSKFNDTWNLMTELQNYCIRDCIALHQIMTKFRESIYINFHVDVLDSPTLASLAFKIFRTGYLKDNCVPLINPKLHYTLKESYFGGITELYKPFAEDVRSYDVNSLYPSVMAKFPMPIGRVHTVKLTNPVDSLDKIELPENVDIKDQTFGFFKVHVTAPDIDKPFLPLRVTTPDGVRTIFPQGTWNGMYFSEEIKNAMKYGYKFKIFSGYVFTKSNIFDKFIEDLYIMKVNSSKDDTNYYIAKLIMNSVYGRFGLNPDIITHKILSENELNEMDSTLITNIIPLEDGFTLVSIKENLEERYIKNISVSISSAIASYARIHMSHYINKYSDSLAYIDTDGVKLTTEMDAAEIDNKLLGFMKYEYRLKEFTGLAPKTYGGILENGGEIVKIKGYSSAIPYTEMKKALNKDYKINLNQEKWYRHVSNSTILIKDTTYALNISENKRVNKFDSNGNFISTSPRKLI